MVGVHPRLRGGALPSTPCGGVAAGPSPPARGSQEPPGGVGQPEGSIPACAGEPRAGLRPSVVKRVHPRLRGGAVKGRTPRGAWTGPSPPARGSRGLVAARGGRWGSIPACAGEPSTMMPSVMATRVHPRLRGGAPRWPSTRQRSRGPSPPARGSRDALSRGRGRCGSIPACAGEPLGPTLYPPPRWVHPRLRGGAEPSAAGPYRVAGPSPPARGSPTRRSRGLGGGGSIPACAGEP